MRGSIKWQVNEIYHKSGIKMIGHSKHKAKAVARKEFSENNQGVTWHSMGKKLGIHSYATADAYRAVWRTLGNYVKENYRIKDMEQIEGKHVQDFLESKISDDVAHQTFMQYAAALEKLETALNGFAERKGSDLKYDFEQSIRNTRGEAKWILARFDGNRAYSDPAGLIKNLTKPEHAVIAKIQYESGARIGECNHLKEKHLLGFEKDKATGEEKGKLLIEKAKGGITGNKYVSVQTYRDLKKMVESAPNGRFEFNIASYRAEIKKAAEKSSQEYNGTHGLRWNFVRERFMEVQREGGQFYEQALVTVSHEMFHHRPDITEHYLR